MTKRPVSVSVALLLVLVNASLWLTFGTIVASGNHPSIPDIPLVRWGMAFLALGAAGIMLGLHFLLRRQSRAAYYVALGLLATISLLIFADQFGLADLVVLLVTLAPLALLIKDRAWFLREGPGIVSRNQVG